MTLQNQLNQVLWHISVTSARPAPALLKQLTDLLINKSKLPLFDNKNINSIQKEKIKRGNISHNSTSAHNTHLATSIDVLIDSLTVYPEYANGLAHFLLRLLNDYDLIELFTDAGIPSDKSFSHSVQELVSHRFLPLLSKDNSVVELIDYLFSTDYDVQWLATIDNDKWRKLIELVKFNFHDNAKFSKHKANSDATINKTINDKERIGDNKIASELHQIKTTHLDQGITNSLITNTQNDLLNAMVILSYRITGIGIHPELMDAYPQRLDYTAAFVAQNQETILFVEEYRQFILSSFNPDNDKAAINKVDPSPLLVMIDQCENLVSTIRKRIYKTGISIRLTNMLLRLEQSLERLRLLTELFSRDIDERDTAFIQLSQSLIIGAKHRYSIRYFINNNTYLLSRKVTENASRVGEHYISTDKSGYKTMFNKAAIGGFVIAFMATIKILSYDLQLAPIGRAFINSMIYGLGFVFIHIIHGTVATKQPAMTAAAIASTISNAQGKKTHQLTKLSELIVDILRTQFVAIMGNVMVAMPIAVAIAIAWLKFTGNNMIDIPKAHHLLEDLDPIHSMALFHAAIAGVFLFLSGLIAGYYDNLAIYNQIGERISRHKLMLKIMPKSWLSRLANFVETNLGAIMGNFLFGVFLGSTATVGYILGLPLDIRHIAFASANFAHGIMNAPVDELSWGLIIWSLIGVALIGIINLMVSFSLALLVALRAKDVHFQEWGCLARKLFEHLITHPKDFILPRPEPMQYSNIDSDGHIINSDNQSNNLPSNTNLSNNALTSHDFIQKMSNRKPVNNHTNDREHIENIESTKQQQTQAAKGSQTTSNTDAPMDMDNQDHSDITLPKPKSPPNLPD